MAFYTYCMCSSTLVYVYEASSSWPFTGDCMCSSTLVYVYEASSSWPFTHTVCVVVLWFMYMKPLLHGLLHILYV